MNRSESPETPLPVPPADSGCAYYADQLTEFCEAMLHSDLQPEGSAVLTHLQACPRCAAAYRDVVTIVTGQYVSALQSAVLDEGLASAVPAGMLDAWRVQLGLRNEFDDRPGAALALSVMGMVHRHTERFDDARDAHELALQTWRKPSVSRVMSRIDLGCLALRNGNALEATRQMALAATSAWRLGDGDAAKRVATLLSRAVGESITESTAAPARMFLAGAYAPGAHAAVAGERVLVINKGQEMRVALWSGPEIDADGYLHVSVGIEDSHLDGLPDVFVIDLLYVPTATVIAHRRIGPVERRMLRVAGGVDIAGRVPGFRQEDVPKGLERARESRRSVPRRTCELRIWWDV